MIFEWYTHLASFNDTYNILRHMYIIMTGKCMVFFFVEGSVDTEYVCVCKERVRNLQDSSLI